MVLGPPLKFSSRGGGVGKGFQRGPEDEPHAARPKAQSANAEKEEADKRKV